MLIEPPHRTRCHRRHDAWRLPTSGMEIGLNTALSTTQAATTRDAIAPGEHIPATTPSRTPQTRRLCELRSAGASDRSDTPTLRAFALLEFLVAADRALTLSEIMRGFDAPKASLHRMLATLEASGLVVREPGGRNAYSIGPRLSRLGIAIATHSGSQQLRHAILARLVGEIGETVNLTMLHETTVLYLDRVEASWPLRLEMQPGTRVPLHCSAGGKLLLALLPGDQRAQLLRQLVLQPFTANTITTLASLKAELDDCARTQIGVDNEEFVAGICCVAVPVHDKQGHVVAALAVHSPTVRTSLSRSLEFVPRLRQSAGELAATF